MKETDGMSEVIEEVKANQSGSEERRRTFGLVLRGRPEDFSWLVERAKEAGLYIVFTKTSFQKIVLKEVPF